VSELLRQRLRRGWWRPAPHTPPRPWRLGERRLGVMKQGNQRHPARRWLCVRCVGQLGATGAENTCRISRAPAFSTRRGIGGLRPRPWPAQEPTLGGSHASPKPGFAVPRPPAGPHFPKMATPSRRWASRKPGKIACWAAGTPLAGGVPRPRASSASSLATARFSPIAKMEDDVPRTITAGDVEAALAQAARVRATRQTPCIATSTVGGARAGGPRPRHGTPLHR
jgi:hypothetical protein